MNLFIRYHKNILLLGIPLIIVLILRILGFNGLYGQDAYEYLRYTNAVTTYLTNGVYPGSFFWPVVYPTLGSILGFFVGGSTVALQLISVFSFSLSCLYTLKTINVLYPKSKLSFLYVFVFGLFSPFLLKMGLIVMSDALAVFFVVLSFYFFFKSYQKNSSVVPIFVFATCALMTRYASLLVTGPILIYSLHLVIKRKAFIPLLHAIFFSGIVTLPFIIFQWDVWFSATSNYFLNEWSVRHFFKSSFTTQDGFTSYKLPNLIYAFYVFFHPGFIFIGAILSVITLKHYKSLFIFHQKIILCCSAVYILFLAGIPFQNPRILGLVFPLILVLLFPAFEKFWQYRLINQFSVLTSIICIGLQLIFFSLTFKPIFKRSIIEKELTAMVKPYQGKTLYSFDVDLALKGRGLNFEFKNMYLEQYTSFQKNDLILFDAERYKTQWKDKTPMQNWEYIKKNYTLKIIETHPEGWKLYKIE